MNYFLNTNKNILTFYLILLILIPIFGFKFLISFMGNILLLLFLIPILLLLVVAISFNSFKSKINTCNKCGSIAVGFNDKCGNCGADLSRSSISRSNQSDKKPSESIIEVKAEEIK